MIKDIKEYKIPYWKNRHILFQLYWRIGSDKKELKLTIWLLKYFKDYEVADWWRHTLLYRGKIK